MTDPSSSIDELIKTDNPFAGHTVVRPQQIWGESFPDVPSINAHVSNTVLEAVKKVNQDQLHHIGITITGEKGLGKTQVISRIRHRLKENDDTLFIYMGQYGNLNLIKSEFLHHVAASLRAFGQYQGVMQCQEIAAALINEGKNFNHTPEKYIKIFPTLLQEYSVQIVDKLTNIILQAKPELDNPYLVKAIIWTLSPQHCTYANYWISGENLTQTKAEELGLPSITKEDREATAFKTVCQILNLVSQYKVPVICFDELDKPESDDNGYLLAQVVATLAKDLSNNLKRSILLLSMYEEIWRDQIKNLPQAEAVIDRIANYPLPREPIHLNYLNADDVVVVVSHWLKGFYQKHQQTPPSPLYPFNENELREFGKNRPTVRDVLSWCTKFLTREEIGTTKASNPVEPVFENELSGLEESLNNILDDSNTIANVLQFSFERLINKTVEGVTVQGVEIFTGRNCYLHFKVVGEEEGNVVKIGIAVVQQSAGNSIQAILGQLINYQRFDLTRGCLVRSKTISSNAKKAQKYFQELVNEKGGEWVKLEAEHLKPLYALSSVYNIREQYNLSEQQIFDFIDEQKLVIDNELICEILSDPSGQIPDNLTDEDIPISLPEDPSVLESDFDLSIN